MPRKVHYHGTAGKDGCIFVEGHQALSPMSAKRFLERRTIVEARPGEKDSFAAGEDWDWYKVKPGRELSAEESKVQDLGFNFVSTTTLVP